MDVSSQVYQVGAGLPPPVVGTPPPNPVHFIMEETESLWKPVTCLRCLLEPGRSLEGNPTAHTVPPSLTPHVLEGGCPKSRGSVSPPPPCP